MRPLKSPWASYTSRQRLSAHSRDPQSWRATLDGLKATLWRSSVAGYRKFAGQVLEQLHGDDEFSNRMMNPSDDFIRLFVRVCKVLQTTLKITPYAEQIMAARIMLDGRVAEMSTGEGKTVAIAIAAAVAALKKIPVHVVTANDYLAMRDAREMAPFFSTLAITVGAVAQSMETAERRMSWGMDITYCSAKELVFDYLRQSLTEASGLSELERLALRLSGIQSSAPVMLRGLAVALVDEIDTVLIDEASVPLVLSQRGKPSPEQDFLIQAAAQAALFQEGHHFTSGAETQSLQLTSAGQKLLQAWPASAHPVYNQSRHRTSTVLLALTALHKLQRDRDYVVMNGQIVIIDETTGRAAKGRAWSRGLHQLVEIKEGVSPTTRNETVCQISYQRFFPRYAHLSGMSGTVRGCAFELATTYGLSVVVVPPRVPRRCQQHKPVVCASSDEMWNAVRASAHAAQNRGQPVLIGTSSVSDSEHLSKLFAAAGLPHALLNARQDEAEGKLIAAAGQQGQVTIATSMAGRGTDIKLGPGVAELGGLHVILCQYNISSRIDRQFLGRAARQGKPGSTEVIVAIDFPMMKHSLTKVTYSWAGNYKQIFLRQLFTAYQWLASDLARRGRMRMLRADIETERELLFNRNKFS